MDIVKQAQGGQTVAVTEEQLEQISRFSRRPMKAEEVYCFSVRLCDDQVDPDVAQRRVELVVDLQSRVMDEYNEQRLGTVMEVLCEGFDSQAGCYVGRTYADSVEIDGHVYFTAAGLVPAGSFVNVRITGTMDGDLTGEIDE